LVSASLVKLSSFARARMRPSDDTNESCFVLFCFVSCRVVLVLGAEMTMGEYIMYSCVSSITSTE